MNMHPSSASASSWNVTRAVHRNIGTETVIAQRVVALDLPLVRILAYRAEIHRGYISSREADFTLSADVAGRPAYVLGAEGANDLAPFACLGNERKVDDILPSAGNRKGAPRVGLVLSGTGPFGPASARREHASPPPIGVSGSAARKPA
jgi:hypothetical protein